MNKNIFLFRQLFFDCSLNLAVENSSADVAGGFCYSCMAKVLCEGRKRENFKTTHPIETQGNCTLSKF